MRGQKATKLIVRVQYWKARRLVRGHDIAGAQQRFQSGAVIQSSGIPSLAVSFRLRSLCIKVSKFGAGYVSYQSSKMLL